MIGIKSLVAGSVLGVIGFLGINTAHAYDPYCAPVRYAPVYVPAPVYYAPRPVITYCPPPAPVCAPPVVIYRPRPVYHVPVCDPRVYTPYEYRHRNSVSVGFSYSGQW